MPPSQRSVTYNAPQRSASPVHDALSCRLVQTKSTFSPRSTTFARELLRELELRERLLEVDDVDAVALGEDEPAHLRVPAAGLVAEVDAGLEQLFERGLCHAGQSEGWIRRRHRRRNRIAGTSAAQEA